MPPLSHSRFRKKTSTAAHSTQPVTVEIFRDFEPPPVPGGARNAASPPPLPAPTTLLVTIPPATASNYVMRGLFHYDDELRPDDFSQHPNAVAVYAVRTRASARKESANSNVVSLRLYPLPEPISDLKPEVTHTGIQLTWTAPAKTPVGPVPPILSYRIYRAPAGQPSAAAQPAAPPTETQSPISLSAAGPLVKIAETQAPSYFDSQVQFGNSYVYSVRSVAEIGGQQLESADSNRAAVLSRDIFPPAAPLGLVVVYVPSQPGGPAHLELSWNISVETDLAGYNVYRSEQSGVQGARLNSEPLPSPAFQDTSAVPGRTYFYSVTAVDRSGKESPAGPVVSGVVPAESQSTP